MESGPDPGSRIAWAVGLEQTQLRIGVPLRVCPAHLAAQHVPLWICPYPGHRGVFGVESHLSLAPCPDAEQSAAGRRLLTSPQGEGL